MHVPMYESYEWEAISINSPAIPNLNETKDFIMSEKDFATVI